MNPRDLEVIEAQRFNELEETVDFEKFSADELMYIAQDNFSDTDVLWELIEAMGKNALLKGQIRRTLIEMLKSSV